MGKRIFIKSAKDYTAALLATLGSGFFFHGICRKMQVECSLAETLFMRLAVCWPLIQTYKSATQVK
ncbi:hypothetical protein [Limnovirga soli]|uniref:Uncharacterized protein n=1 Tax=Limnovirga soli TaxID=2656915 RepID=A0A8J8FDC7_9BACT|nr:hypothetical protein [Limnovirga soli]NNV55675.1 hypothetical protein [Limnovirga soli]